MSSIAEFVTAQVGAVRSIEAQLSDQFSWLSHQCIEQNPALFSGGRDDGSDDGEVVGAVG